MLGTSSWQLRDSEQIVACNRSLLGHRHFLIGITRVRNEALILRDTLDYVGKHVDAKSPMMTRVRIERWRFLAGTQKSL